MMVQHTVFLFEECNASYADSVRNSDRFKKCLILRTESFDDAAPNLFSYLSGLARQHSLLKNWQTTLVSYKEFYESLKVVLSRLNKVSHGEFNASASDVITTQMKYASGEDNKSTGAYKYYLDECNCLDQYGLLRVLEENRHLLEGDFERSFLIEGIVRTTWQQSAIEFLSNGKQLKKIQTETPIETAISCVLDSQIFIEDDASIIPKDESIPKYSQSLEYTLAILKSFITLLVNTRDEMAISSALACPLIKLSHEAFTVIKRAAATDHSPIYQFILSYVMKKRLGGAGYAAASNCPIKQYLKELMNFVDVMDKLQTFIEENQNSVVAINKVTMCILNKLSKEIPMMSFKSQMIEKSKDLIEVLIKRIGANGLEVDEKINQNIIGRNTIWMLRCLSDEISSLGFYQKPSKLLCSPFSAATPSKTPVGSRTLFKLFKSPSEKFIEDEDCVPLNEREPEPKIPTKKTVKMPFSVAYDPEVPRKLDDDSLIEEDPATQPLTPEVEKKSLKLRVDSQQNEVSTPILKGITKKRRGNEKNVAAKKRLKLVSADDPENKEKSSSKSKKAVSKKKIVVPSNQKSINSFFTKAS